MSTAPSALDLWVRPDEQCVALTETFVCSSDTVDIGTRWTTCSLRISRAHGEASRGASSTSDAVWLRCCSCSRGDSPKRRLMGSKPSPNTSRWRFAMCFSTGAKGAFESSPGTCATRPWGRTRGLRARHRDASVLRSQSRHRLLRSAACIRPVGVARWHRSLCPSGRPRLGRQWPVRNLCSR